jgi:hypothetical protein
MFGRSNASSRIFARQTWAQPKRSVIGVIHQSSPAPFAFAFLERGCDLYSTEIGNVLTP